MAEPLSFGQARYKVLNAIKDAAGQLDTAEKGDQQKYVLLYILLSPILCIAFFVIALFSNTNNVSSTGLTASICIIFVVSCVNVVLAKRTRDSENKELKEEVNSMASDFEEFLKYEEKYDAKEGTNSNEGEATASILSGHSHINIVTTYRNKQWQRIPTLLLAEGDIIALMGGDISPGRAFELLPLPGQAKASSALSSFEPQLWRRGPLVERGVKIYLRTSQGENLGNNHTAPSVAPSYERHRSLASDSVELLILSGDIRCFLLAETPVEGFTRNVLNDSKNKELAEEDIGVFRRDTTTEDEDKVQRDDMPIFPLHPFSTDPMSLQQSPGDENYAKTSILRCLFRLLLTKGLEFMCVEVAVFLVVAAIRLALVPECRDNWAESTLLPVAVICLCLIPVSLPLLLWLAEAFMTADVLSTVELILLGEEEDDEDDGKGKQAADNRFSDTRQGDIGQKEERKYTQTPRADEVDDFSEDSNFDDNDIDDRIEEEADADAKIISSWRWLQYFLHVLAARVGLTGHSGSYATQGGTYLHVEREDSDLSDLTEIPFLPVPLTKARTLEVLGAVTMICFIDDDVICEPYSVTEEVFLLDAPSADHTDVPRHSSPGQDGTKHHANKGVVLDLHANPDATGSRFEDPSWWRKLSSLKPIGLNALLTHAPTPPPTSSARSGDFVIEQVGVTSMPLGANFPLGSSQGTLNTDNGAKHTKNRHRASPYFEEAKEKVRVKSPMQESLVRHIRKAIPLESLRELAEEIGFVDDDVAPFLRLLETNIIAPSLGDVKLLEDTHAWGQEDSRRRGMLYSQARGVFVKDGRGGALQLMSQGDPALILNYCREYWDGSSITPFSATDRQEVLAAYERWAIEDFDVVAFSYAPVPSALQPLIVRAHQENLRFQSENFRTQIANDGPSLASLSSPQVKKTSLSEANCLFFVDPRTSQQLAERVTTGKSVIENKTEYINNAKHTSTIIGSPPSSTEKQDRRSTNVVDSSISEVGTEEEMRELWTSVNKLKTKSSISIESPPKLVKAEDSLAVTGAVSVMPSFGRSKKVDFPALDTSHEPQSDPSITKNDQQDHESGLLGPTLAFASVNASPYTFGGVRPRIQRVHSDSALESSIKSDKHYTAHAPFGDSALYMDNTDIHNDSESNTSHVSGPVAGLVNLIYSVDLEEYLQGSNNDESDTDLYEFSIRGGVDVNAEDGLQLLEEELKKDVEAGISRIVESNGEEDSGLEKDNTVVRRGRSKSTASMQSSDRNSIESVDSRLSDQLSDSEKSEAVGSDDEVYCSETELLLDKDISGSRDSEKGLEELPSRTIANLDLQYADDDTIIGEEVGALLKDTPDPEAGGAESNFDAEGDVPPPPQLVKARSLDTGLSNTGDLLVCSESPASISAAMENKVDISNEVISFNEKEKVSMLHSPLFHKGRERFSSVGSVLSDKSWISSIGDNLVLPVVPTFQMTPGNPSPNSRLRARQNSISAAQKKETLQQRRHNRRITKNLGASLWPLLRQQVFLGMAASSVPVKSEVPKLMEDLTAAGVRFVYFSPRNMRRSKPVAEKIGIQFDWNCAISLRALDMDVHQHDPHRYISNYADWDVHARMPHGVEAIKTHLKEVDNVPLLVSLYTDSTPDTTRQMVEVFRSYGEVVLTVGSTYRANNSEIFQSANIAVPVAMLPGDQEPLPIHCDSVLRGFPEFCCQGLTRADLMLAFRLVSLNTINLLQTPPTQTNALPSAFANHPQQNERGTAQSLQNGDIEIPFSIDVLPAVSAHCSSAGPQVRMEALLEAVRKGRVLLLNALQALACLCVSLLSLCLWPLVAALIPTDVPPGLSPAIALLFLFIYIPTMLFNIINSSAPKNVLKKTPRKNIFSAYSKDEIRFTKYLFCRAGYVALSLFLIGWLASTCLVAADIDGKNWYDDIFTIVPLLGKGDTGKGLRDYWLVQDLMATQLLLGLLTQSCTLLERGQTVDISSDTWWEDIPIFKNFIGFMLLLPLHAVVLFVRALFRGGLQRYAQLDYTLWACMGLLSIGGIFVGLAVNAHDKERHMRHLQFLRLDFDTKLGMHSPR